MVIYSVGALAFNIFPKYDEIYSDAVANTNNWRKTMMYPYLTFSDETLVTHSQAMDRDGITVVEVHFERPVENDFNSARCVLPFYEWTIVDGYTDEEIDFFLQFLQSNAHLLYRYAEDGGMKIA